MEEKEAKEEKKKKHKKHKKHSGSKHKHKRSKHKKHKEKDKSPAAVSGVLLPVHFSLLSKHFHSNFCSFTVEIGASYQFPRFRTDNPRKPLLLSCAHFFVSCS